MDGKEERPTNASWRVQLGLVVHALLVARPGPNQSSRRPLGATLNFGTGPLARSRRHWSMGFLTLTWGNIRRPCAGQFQNSGPKINKTAKTAHPRVSRRRPIDYVGIHGVDLGELQLWLLLLLLRLLL